jgi:hypothetical protein
MNLVEQIKSQLSEGLIHQLSSLIGANEGATKSAVGAAVPALLSALANLTSSGGGAQKLISALGKLDDGSLGNLGNMLSGQSGSVLELGSSLLQSLFGNNIVSGIVNALSRYAGLGSGTVQKLLGYLTPLVLGAIGGRFAGRGVNAQGLANLFAEQKANITHALPSGLSLDEVPGLAAGRQAVPAPHEPVPSQPVWLWSLLPLLALGLLTVYLFRSCSPTPTTHTTTDRSSTEPTTRSTVPDVTRLSDDFSRNFKSMDEALNSIKDVASAEGALPKLRDFSDKLDSMKALVDKLPEAGKARFTDLLKTDFGKLQDQLISLMWIPDVGSKIKTVANDITRKMASLGDFPVSKAPQLSSDLADAFSSLTGTLTGVKDPATAEAALPKLREINGKLESAKATMDTLPSNSKSILHSLIKTSLAKLKGITDKVLAIAGVGDQFKTVVTAIMGTLNTLAG